MTPVFCAVKHNPDAGTYGDCVRACVATILDNDDVPHFFHDGTVDGFERLREWLVSQKLAPFVTAYPGSIDDVFAFHASYNPDGVYMLFHRSASGVNHCVVCKGGAVLHDPAWVRSPIAGPQDEHWLLMVIGKA